MVSTEDMSTLARVCGFVAIVFATSPGIAQDASATTEPPVAVAGEAACAKGQALANAGHSMHAHLLLARCHRSTPTAANRKLLIEVRSALRRETASMAPVSLALTPSSARASLAGESLPEAYMGNVLLDEDELWLPVGHYELEVSAPGFEGGRYAIDVDSPDRVLVPVSLRELPESGPSEIDMSDEQGAELGQVATAVDPRPKEFETLLAKRYRRAPNPVPIPLAPEKPGRGPWPYLAAGLGLAAVGSGIVLHTRDNAGLALASYAGGAVLLGVSTFLFLREPEEQTKSMSVGVTRDAAFFVWRGGW